MKKISLKLSKENKTIIAIIILIAIIFGFNDKKESFTFSAWIINFIFVLFISAISFLVTLLGYYLASKYFHSTTSVAISQLERLGIQESAEIARVGFRNLRLKRTPLRKIPLGIIIAVLVTLISNGKIFFTAFYSLKTESKRIGYRFKYTSNLEEGLIAFTGLISLFILLFIFNIINLEKGTQVTTWLIIWQLLPIANLPGGKMLMGSRTLWILAVSFSLFALLLIPVLHVALTIFLSVLFALAVTILYFKQVEYK